MLATMQQPLHSGPSNSVTGGASNGMQGGGGGAAAIPSWASLGSMSSASAAGNSSPRSTRSNSLNGGGGGTMARPSSSLSVPAAGVPQPTDEELAGRTFLEWIRSWDDEQVANWLADNRCGAHAQTFANNDIRGNVLLDVDQQALKEMGVQSVGDRIKITVAVKKLRQACTTANMNQQLAARQRTLQHTSSNASLQSNAMAPSSNPSSPVYATHPHGSGGSQSAVVTQAQLARRVSSGKTAHRIPPPLHLSSSSVADTRLPQAYQTSAQTPGTSSANAATYGARTSSNAANTAIVAASGAMQSVRNAANGLLSSPRTAMAPATASGKALPPGPHSQMASNLRPSTAPRSQHHLGAPTISTTAASPTNVSPQSSLAKLNQWSHRKAGSTGGSISSISSVNNAYPQNHPRPSTAAASYQQQSQAESISPTTDTFAQNATLHATSPYKVGAKGGLGSQGLSPIVETHSSNVSPVTSEYPAQALSGVKTSAAQGYTVGKGGFARPTTAGGTVSIGAASGSGQVMPLDDVLRKTVKFISDDNVSKMVNLEGAKDPRDALLMVLKKFNKIAPNAFPSHASGQRVKSDTGEFYAELDGYGIFTTYGDGNFRALTESELWSVCQSASRPERSRGLLLRKVHVTPTSPEEARAFKTRKLRNFFGEDLARTGISPTSPTGLLDVSIPSTAAEPSSPAPSSPSTSSDRDDSGSTAAPTPPQKQRQARNTMNRASTVSIMSGLNWGFGNNVASQAQTRSPSTSFLQTNSQKLKSFFGQRPPSELINTHLVEYFPTAANEKKILSKTVRNNVRKSMLRRNSSFNPLLSGAGKTSWDASRDSANLQGLGLSRFSISSVGSNYRDSLDVVPPLPSKENHPLTSRFSEDYDVSPTRPPLLGHLSTSSAAPSISIDSDEDESVDSRSVSSGAHRRSTRKERPSSRLSVWSHTKSNRDSDNASLLTVEEITEDLEKRRLSRASWLADNASELAHLGDDSTDGTVSDTAPSSKLDVSDDMLEVGSLQNDIIMEEEDEEEDEEEEEEEEDEDDEDAIAEEEEEADELDVPRAVTAKAKKSTFRWVRGALIGAGSFGQVYLGMNATNGSFMAVKQVELPTGNSHNEERKKSMLSALEREIELLKDIQHENIVQYLDSSSDGKNLYIFLEYVPGGSIAHLLANLGAFEETLVRTFVRQILLGLAYLHENDIIHRDIKGANILVDNRGGIKISDFGISKKVEENLLTSTSRIHRPSLQGSVFWMAPEVVKQTSYTAKADIWSLGCLIVEMFTGQHPWMELTQMQAIFKIGSSKDARPKNPEHISADGKKFLDLTFHMDYNERPTAAELSKHAFITQDLDE